MPRMIAMNKLYIQWFCSDGIIRLVSKQTIPRIAYVNGAVEHSSTIKKLKWFRFRSPKICNRINQNLLLFVFELFVRWSFPTYLRLMPGGNQPPYIHAWVLGSATEMALQSQLKIRLFYDAKEMSTSALHQPWP